MVQINFRLAVLLAIGMASCCGQRELQMPITFEVKGKVVSNKGPLAGVTVRLYPRDASQEIPWIPIGETGKNGEFTLKTGGAENGVPPGNYVATFEKIVVSSDREHSGLEMEIDSWKGKYGDPLKSPFEVTIEDHDTILEPFELQ